MPRIIRGSNTFDQLPPGVKGLLIANGIVFLLQMILPGFSLERLGGLQPLNGVGMGRFWPWQLITYSFIHGNGLHLLLNMFALWMFGINIEFYWGTKKFLLFYFLCVLGAGLTHLLAAPGAIAIGASGGIYGILLAFGFLFPDSVIYFFFLFPLRAIQAVFIMAILTLAFAMNSGGSKIAHFAHLGGMLTGFLYFKVPQWFQDIRFWNFKMIFSRPKRINARKSQGLDEENLAKEVDRILEKISSQGINSLTFQEHELMQSYAKQKK